MEDKRFAHIANDPKFKTIPKGARKVKIDKRFQSMFNDKQFKVKYTVDKRGRPVNQTSSEDLRRYYDLSSEDEGSADESEKDEVQEKEIKAPKGKGKQKLNIVNGVPQEVKSKLKNLSVDYARGESALFSESSSDEDESEEEVEEEVIEHNWGELDVGAETTEEATRRLAVCNLDWDRIRAVDIMVLLNSFLPPGGAIKSVAIYPSEYGKKRMKEEDIKGPIELVDAVRNKKVDDTQEETEEGANYHMEKLRQYQLNRLKYYYSVVTFDSEASASKVYTECDGMEYESSATKVDLRFIPDDMEFDDEPKEFCDKLPESNKYLPRFFTNTALQQAKVDLTWDETNPDRVEMTQKLNSGKIEDISEADLQNYLAPSSDESSDEDNSDNEDNDNPIEKYKALLMDIESKERKKGDKDIEMEVKWGVDLEEKTNKLVKKKLAEKEDKTPFQQFLDKRKEKRKEKRDQKKKENEDSTDEEDVPSDVDLNDPYFAEEFNTAEFKKKKKPSKNHDDEETNTQKDAELELLLMNEEDNKNHFSLKKIQDGETDSKSKKKRNKKKEIVKPEDNFEVDVSDARFSAVYSSHHYNIDPSDSHYKKTKGMETLIQEKLKRKNTGEISATKKIKVGDNSKKKSAELSVLVKSVKRKAEAFRNK